MSEDRSQRVHLPQRARDNGFPRHQPVVAGFPDAQLPKRLYDAFKLLDIKREMLEDSVPVIVGRLPLTQIIPFQPEQARQRGI